MTGKPVRLAIVVTTHTFARPDTRALARFFRVLGDPTRLRIIELLGDGPLTVSELVERLDLPRSRVSNHLACLKHCRFVDASPQGRAVRYELVDDAMQELLGAAWQVAGRRAAYLASCDRIGPDWL
jgi:DNA-binding transcriptional ArsR family regulator